MKSDNSPAECLITLAYTIIYLWMLITSMKTSASSCTVLLGHIADGMTVDIIFYEVTWRTERARLNKQRFG